jgi:hypothetical protein
LLLWKDPEETATTDAVYCAASCPKSVVLTELQNALFSNKTPNSENIMSSCQQLGIITRRELEESRFPSYQMENSNLNVMYDDGKTMQNALAKITAHGPNRKCPAPGGTSVTLVCSKSDSVCNATRIIQKLPGQNINNPGKTGRSAQSFIAEMQTACLRVDDAVCANTYLIKAMDEFGTANAVFTDYNTNSSNNGVPNGSGCPAGGIFVEGHCFYNVLQNGTFGCQATCGSLTPRLAYDATGASISPDSCKNLLRTKVSNIDSLVPNPQPTNTYPCYAINDSGVIKLATGGDGEGGTRSLKHGIRLIQGFCACK